MLSSLFPVLRVHLCLGCLPERFSPTRRGGSAETQDDLDSSQKHSFQIQAFSDASSSAPALCRFSCCSWSHDLHAASLLFLDTPCSFFTQGSLSFFFPGYITHRVETHWILKVFPNRVIEFLPCSRYYFRSWGCYVDWGVCSCGAYILMGQKTIHKKIPGSDKCCDDEGLISGWVVREGLSKEVTFKLKLEGHKGGSYVYMCLPVPG